jgi:hypothetical protein
MTMSITRRAELAHRSGDGIDVYLFWNEPTNRVTVGVVDARTDDGFELEVDGRYALDAFNHPYAYAALGATTDPRRATRRPRRLARHGQRLAGNNHQPTEERSCTHGSITRRSPFPAL